MAFAAVIVLLALVFAGVGLLLEGLRWALVIGIVLLLAGGVSGLRVRARSARRPGRAAGTA